jgi:nucleoside-diphosphate-sugar epimerase
MRVLVTGALGFIGSHLVRSLLPEHEVFALVRAPAAEVPEGVRLIEQDLTRPLNHALLPPRIDAVVYLAQSRFYKQFPSMAKDIFEVNIGGLFRLLDYAAASGVGRFIYASSGGVYGFSETDRAFVETDVVAAPDFYLRSKHAAELLVESYAQIFVTTIFRLFFPYGARQPETMLIPRLANSISRGEPVLLQQEDGLMINPIHVSDVADAFRQSLKFETSDTFNLGGDEALSLREISRIIGEAVGREPLFTIQDGERPRRLLGDIGKIKARLGIKPRRFSEGIIDVCRELGSARAAK